MNALATTLQGNATVALDLGLFEAGTYEITSTGVISLAGAIGSGFDVDPDGVPVSPIVHPSYLYFNPDGADHDNGTNGQAGAGVNLGSVIVSYTGTAGSWFSVGASHTLTIEASSHLYVAINDTYPTNNAGSFEVRVEPAVVSESAIVMYEGGCQHCTWPRSSGWEFTSSDMIDVSSLGVFDKHSDGLPGDIIVGIYNAAGVLLTSASLNDSNTALSGPVGILDDGTTGQFRYLDLASPLTLNADQTYYVARSGSHNSSDVQTTLFGGIYYVGTEITVLGGRLDFTSPIDFSSITFPDATYGNILVGANFKYQLSTVVNTAPELAPIGDKPVDEGQDLSFTVTASDNEGPTTLSVGNLPLGATFDPAIGIFDWAPDYGTAGNYEVFFTATDEGGLTDQEMITITVGDVNRAPNLVNIGDQSVSEGDDLTFDVVAIDPDGDAISYQATNLPLGATFDVVTQTFSWIPNYGDAGSYSVVFTVVDDGIPALSVQEVVVISVGDVNRPPTLSLIGPKPGVEGQVLSFLIAGTDPDEDSLTYSASNLPSGAQFDSATNMFSWQPGYGDAGSYFVTFIVNDNGVPPLGDQEAVTLTIGNVNRPPVLGVIGPQSTDEGVELSFAVNAIDPDGDSLSYSAGNIPNGAVFDILTQNFTWTPLGFDEAGDYTVIFSVVDNGTPAMNDQEEVTIVVGNVNRPPVIDAIGDRTVAEDEVLSFAVTATDPDGDALLFTVNDLPLGAMFDSTSQLFSWMPEYNQAGNYSDIEFVVTDDGDPIQLDVETISISVGNTNRAPSFDVLGSQEVSAGETLSFVVNASDPDGDAVVLSSSLLPTGASFDAVSGQFIWASSSNQAGNYTVAFLAEDNGVPTMSDTLQVAVTIGEYLTPRKRIKNLIKDVKELGLLKKDRKKLLKPLRKAKKRVAKGKVTRAMTSLNKFIETVEALVIDGTIESSEGDQLVATANDVLDVLTNN